MSPQVVKFNKKPQGTNGTIVSRRELYFLSPPSIKVCEGFLRSRFTLTTPNPLQLFLTAL